MAKNNYASREMAALKLGVCHLLDQYGDRCGKPAATWSSTGACESHAIQIYREVQRVIERDAPHVVYTSRTK